MEKHRFLVWPAIAAIFYSLLIAVAMDSCRVSAFRPAQILTSAILGALFGTLTFFMLRKYVKDGLFDYNSVPVVTRVGFFAAFLGALALLGVTASFWDQLPILAAIFFLHFYASFALAVAKLERIMQERIMCDRLLFFETYALNYMILFFIAYYVVPLCLVGDHLSGR
ncbi:hypothetical protein HZA56_14850 [Candidatus Poribacteria bacterium]|nr:hypothetical protein [Candidatus Poribacteria bacterium]